MSYDQPDAVPVDYVSLIEQDRRDEERQRKASYAAEISLSRRLGEAQADQEEAALRRVEAEWGDSIRTEATRWLWRDRMPLGGLSLIAGKGDVSKSTLMATQAAWLSTGRMKGEFYGTPQNVAYVVNEDSKAQTVKPRMIANGADMARIAFPKVVTPLGKESLKLPRDIDALRAFVKTNNIVAVFVDPLSANVTGRRNDQGDMRDTFQAINELAEECGIAIIGLAHTRKAGAADILEAIMGSSEQSNVARSVHGLVMDEKESGARILSCEKLNLGQKHLLRSLRFTVESVPVKCDDGKTVGHPRIKWLEEVDETASDVLSDLLNGTTKSDEAALWLNEYLMKNGGQCLASDAYKDSPREYGDRMLRRALDRIGGKAQRLPEQKARSMWFHPSAIHTQTSVSSVSSVQVTALADSGGGAVQSTPDQDPQGDDQSTLDGLWTDTLDK